MTPRLHNAAGSDASDPTYAHLFWSSPVLVIAIWSRRGRLGVSRPTIEVFG
jgi:hypothetical protein